MKKDEKLDTLKDILLTDEREYALYISERLEILEDIINKRKALSSKVDPIIDKKLSDFVKTIPKTLGPTITETLRKEIKNSKNEVVEALYPIMGQMIKKYIQNEIRLLSERVDEKLKRYSFKSLWRKIKSVFTGVKESEMLLKQEIKSVIKQVLIIENDSGILLSDVSDQEKLDKDMVAGMLTAIKNFVEDAFISEKQQLQSLEYDFYHIHLQNFTSFYIALVIEGEYSFVYKSELEDRLFKLIKYHRNKTGKINYNALSENILSKLN